MKQVKIMQIIHLALGAGVAIFNGVILIMVSNNTNGELATGLGRQAKVAAIFGIVASFGSMMTFRIMIAKPSEDFIRTFQVAHIVRLAILEGSAMFGSVILLMHAQNGGMLTKGSSVLPAYIPVILFFVVLLISYPSDQRVKLWMKI